MSRVNYCISVSVNQAMQQDMSWQTVNCNDFYAWQHICYSAYMLSPVRPSVCHTGGSYKNSWVRITKFSPSFSNLKSKFYPEILRGSSRAGALNEGWVDKIWQAFASRGFVSDSWALLFQLTNSANLAIFDFLAAISPKRCKIGLKLPLITNRNVYTRFPKSMTLSDPWPGFQGHGRQNCRPLSRQYLKNGWS